MRELKRILLVIPNLDFGGAQTSFARLTQLLQNDCKLLLVVFNKDNIAPLDLRGELVDLTVDAGQSYLMKLINFIKRVKRLRQIKKRFKPDASISFLEGADYVNILSSVYRRLLTRAISDQLSAIARNFVRYYFSPSDCKSIVLRNQLKLE